MKQTKWSEVEMTGPAVAGLLVGVGAGFVAGPIAAIAGGLVTTIALAGYRIVTRK